MTRSFAAFVAVLVTVSMHVGSAQRGATPAEKLLASAQHKASIDGDLKGAIDEYKKALAAAGGNRALAAQALLRMAECHHRLGEAEAQTIYARVVRDYSDQRDAAVVARARLLAPTATPQVKGDRSVWVGPEADGFGTISSDGRFLTYTDWSNDADLALRDLRTGTNHRLTTGGSSQFSAISRDGRQLAYQWWGGTGPWDTRRHELRVARLHASSISESRVLVHNDDVADIQPYDWSPDGKSIAVGVGRKDRTIQIGLVDTQDGSLRVLKSLDWKKTNKVLFSPDGRYIAYDHMVNDSSDERHVFVMATDGSRESVVVAHSGQNVVMGWSPDGRHVLFASDRSGSVGLWAVPVSDAKATGTPILVKADVSSTWSLGLTATGTMYVWKSASPIYVQTSAIDLTSGTLVSSSSTFQRFISSRGRPDWSADGKYLAYQSCAPLGGGPCTLWIRSMETGALRELKPKLGYFFFPRWSPDGQELLAAGRDIKGRNNGLYRIDVRTGDAMLVGDIRAAGGETNPEWAPDGKHVHYRRGASVVERHLASGAEREVVRIPTIGVGNIAVSPDGRSVAYEAGQSAGTRELYVMPLAGGGAPRAVFQVKAPERLHGRFDWTNDGRALAVGKLRPETGGREVWIVDVAGGQARKLDVDATNWMMEDGFRFDRAGKQVAFVAAAGQLGAEIRALENFLPPSAATAQAAKK